MGRIYQSEISNLAVLRDRIAQHVSTVHSPGLHSDVESAVYHMQILEQGDGRHVEPYIQ